MTFELNWGVLADQVSPRTDRVSFELVSDQFKKIAWDIYKPLSGSDTLWELRDEGDGKFLYALYGDDKAIIAEASARGAAPAGDWVATSDRGGRNITLSFRNVPIKRFASTEFGFEPTEAEDFASFLTTQVADPAFVNRLVDTLPEEKKVAVAQLINQRGA